MSHALQVGGESESRVSRGIKFVYHTFLRLLALCFFALAIYTWLSSIGFWEGLEFRFDTMTTEQRIYKSVLLVLTPVAAVGLWTTLPWGRVMWLLAVGVQVASIFYFNAQPPFKNELLMFHLGSLVLYVVFEILVKVVANKA